jgi:hypothetical protein
VGPIGILPSYPTGNINKKLREMLHKHFKGTVVVHGKEVYWLSNPGSKDDSCVGNWTIDQFLSDPNIPSEIPIARNSNHQILCIVPDHWFGMEIYPFQTQKRSLIELFLERKLTSTFPERTEIRDYFTYKWSAATNEPDRLLVYFLQDSNAYSLLRSLGTFNLSPGLITTPAFLWQGKLSELVPEFSRQGTLLIHAYEHECSLYFYSKGNYLFSRNVQLSDVEDGIDTLRFEINQSLYMFSQKTKSEINNYYIWSDSSIKHTVLGTALGRTLIDIAGDIEIPTSLVSTRVPLINGLVPLKGFSNSSSILGVVHRGMKRDLEWEPAQRVGAALGMFACTLFLGESLYLHSLIQEQKQENLILQSKLQNLSKASLPEYESAVDHLLRVSKRTSGEEVIRRLLKTFPPNVFMQDVVFKAEDKDQVAIHARVNVATTDELRDALLELVKKVRATIHQANTFSINDIEIQWAPQGDGTISSRYLIAFQVNVS